MQIKKEIDIRICDACGKETEPIQGGYPLEVERHKCQICGKELCEECRIEFHGDDAKSPNSTNKFYRSTSLTLCQNCIGYLFDKVRYNPDSDILLKRTFKED